MYTGCGRQLNYNNAIYYIKLLPLGDPQIRESKFSRKTLCIIYVYKTGLLILLHCIFIWFVTVVASIVLWSLSPEDVLRVLIHIYINIFFFPLGYGVKAVKCIWYHIGNVYKR